MATTAATVAAAMAAKARREIREHFDGADAFEPYHAVPYDPPDNMHRRQLDLMIGKAIVRETGDCRYWIDREAERLEEERRNKAAKLMFKILVIAIVISIGGVAIVKAISG